jgi:hypothetical protein
MSSMFIVIFVGFVIVVAVLGYFGHLAAKRRREALAELARRLGFRFDPLTRRGAPHWGEPFELFRRGNQYGTKNHLTGMWRGLAARDTGLQREADRLAVPAEVFDYTYYTESRDSKGNRPGPRAPRGVSGHHDQTRLGLPRVLRVHRRRRH